MSGASFARGRLGESGCVARSPGCRSGGDAGNYNGPARHARCRRRSQRHATPEPPLIRRYHSAIAGALWPALPGPEAAQALALQFQLERSQWLAPGRLRELQFRQLDALARHAHASVPFYRARWSGAYRPGEPLTPEAVARLPLLRRGDLQRAFKHLRSRSVPASHGAVVETRTSGSTGMPVRVLKTALVEALWRALTLREHIWHRRDLGGRLAAIRHGAPEGEGQGWGPATDTVAVTGPSATLSIRHPVEAQLRWLERQQPDYLLSYPSNLAELARLALALGNRLPRLREVRAFGETLDPEVRELCRRAWGVPVTDAYSSQEVGQIAFQCPESGRYHVQSETLLVEVLDDQGRECAPGEIGRVVVTCLHNFAMPLVRYEIGDYAVAGAPCRCGRGLPVLERVMGRARNMLLLADGSRYWPAFGSRSFGDIAPVLQHQLVQKSFEVIEARLVTARPLAAEEEERLRRQILSRLPVPFEVRFSYREAIPRSPSGKFEDFISEVSGGAR